MGKIIRVAHLNSVFNHAPINGFLVEELRGNVSTLERAMLLLPKGIPAKSIRPAHRKCRLPQHRRSSDGSDELSAISEQFRTVLRSAEVEYYSNFQPNIKSNVRRIHLSELLRHG
jgi:hypothetical protein